MGILQLTARLLQAREARERRREERRLVRELSTTQSYAYTVDYITGNVEIWARLFGSFAGRPTRMLEIGSYEGRSTVWFLQNVLTDAASRLVCVDIFSEPSRNLRFEHNVRVSGFEHKVTKLKGRSGDRLRELPAMSFDVIY